MGEVKVLAKYLDEDVLRDFVASSDLEVQERASVMHHFVKYVVKHLEKGDNISEDFQLFFAGELNPVAPKAQKKVPIPEGLDLDAWINEPPSESEPDSEDSADENGYGNVGNDNVFGVPGGASSNKSTPSKKAYVEPSEEELQKSRQERTALQNSNPNYLKGTVKSSPSRSLSSKEISEIPVQKIDLEVPLHTISGLANIDHYIDMKNGKKGKEKKKKKKKGKDKKESEEEPEEEDQTPSVFVSRNAEMPEGYVSDGDEDEENDAAHDDPHKALGAINLDDLDSIPAYVPIDTTKDQIGDMFGSSSSGKKIHSHQITDDNAKSKKKKSKEKKEKKGKKSKKSKKSKSDSPDQLLVETDNKVVQVNGSNNKTVNKKAAEQAHHQTDDLEFWLSPSNQLPAAPSSVEKPQQAQEELPTEKSKKKHKKKSSKHVKHSEKQVNGISKSSPSPPALSLTLLASNSSLKLSYDVWRVPMEPEKMTVGVSFCNVGTTPISSVELDFLDNANVQVVHDSSDKGIKLEMDLEAGKVEDHLFLFQITDDTMRQMIRGTATYSFKSGGQDKLDFKLLFKGSKFMVAESEGLTELLSKGVLEHASSLTKPLPTNCSGTFDQILAKLSGGIYFAVVERVDSTAYMHAKTMKSQHSVAFLIKHNENKGCLVVDGKATHPSILATLTDEIREMDIL